MTWPTKNPKSLSFPFLYASTSFGWFCKTSATACDNCHTQLSNLNDHYKMGVDVQYLSSLVADALVQ